MDVAGITSTDSVSENAKVGIDLENEKAIQEAIETEKENIKLRLMEEFNTEKTKFEEEKQIWLEEAVNKALSEKNNQIDMLLTRQDALMTECQRHRNTIKLLTDGEHIRTA